MNTKQKAEAWVNRQRIIRSIIVNKHEPMEHITALLKENRVLLDAANGVMAIVKKSRGVDGFHLNGDIAEWDYFDEVDALEKAIAMCEGKE